MAIPILIGIGIVACAALLWRMRRESRRLDYRGHEITGLDLWKARRK
jgi:hypothetical protein